MNTRIKRLIKQYIELLILDELRKHELHGYGFIELIKNRYGFKPSPSMVYPVLKELMKKGFVTAEERHTGSRRYTIYHITEKGLEFLRKNRDLLEKAKRHEEKVRLAANIGFFKLLRSLRLLFDQLDRLNENKLFRVQQAINTFLIEIEDLVKEDERG